MILVLRTFECRFCSLEISGNCRFFAPIRAGPSIIERAAPELRAQNFISSRPPGDRRSRRTDPNAAAPEASTWRPLARGPRSRTPGVSTWLRGCVAGLAQHSASAQHTASRARRCDLPPSIERSLPFFRVVRPASAAAALSPLALAAVAAPWPLELALAFPLGCAQQFWTFQRADRER
jgi:hypothetical protein